MTENDISFVIRGCIFNVYNKLGPGMLESVYEATLKYELDKEGLTVRSQVTVPLVYDNMKIDTPYRLDLLVDDQVIVEIKSVDHLLDVHHKQLVTYLKLTGLKLGLLVNFHTDDIAKSVFRKVNGLQV